MTPRVGLISLTGLVAALIKVQTGVVLTKILHCWIIIIFYVEIIQFSKLFTASHTPPWIPRESQWSPDSPMIPQGLHLQSFLLRIFEYSLYVINISSCLFTRTLLPNLFIHFIHYVDYWHLIFFPEAEMWVLVLHTFILFTNSIHRTIFRQNTFNTSSYQKLRCEY